MKIILAILGALITAAIHLGLLAGQETPWRAVQPVIPLLAFTGATIPLPRAFMYSVFLATLYALFSFTPWSWLAATFLIMIGVSALLQRLLFTRLTVLAVLAHSFLATFVYETSVALRAYATLPSDNAMRLEQSFFPYLGFSWLGTLVMLLIISFVHYRLFIRQRELSVSSVQL